MWALAVETTQAVGSIALFRDKKFVSAQEWHRDGSHSEFITVAVNELLGAQNITLKDITRFGVSIGPGSFTGIRVGLNFVRTAAYVFQKPVFCISALELLAGQARSIEAPTKSRIYVIQFAFRDLFYFQAFDVVGRATQPHSEPLALTLEEIATKVNAPGLALGNGFQHFGPDLLSKMPNTLVRDPRLKDEVQAKFFEHTEFPDQGHGRLLAWNSVVPLYIRASEAEEKLRRGLLKPL